MMPHSRPYALSIAGFDPSGGAGLLADAKTFEANAVYGLGVVSALTWQNDIAFEKLEWTAPGKIIHQLQVLQERFPLRYIKIGLIEDLRVLQTVTGWLKQHATDACIVWDPVLRASAGFSIHDQVDTRLLGEVLKDISCITPNLPEARRLFGGVPLHEELLAQSRHTAVYLKGGHDTGTRQSTDTLYYRESSYVFSNPRLPKGEKHGSGCVLSSALAAQLALGRDMPAAAAGANAYTYQFLSSNDSLLGYHYSNNDYANNQ